MVKSRANRASPSRPYEVLFQMVIGKWISQALGTVVEIGIPEQLAKGARRCSDIAREAGVSEDGIYRLLRALASVGLFVESADRRFKLTGMGKLLRSDHPESLAGYARFVAHDSTWRPWGQLGYSVKTGMPANTVQKRPSRKSTGWYWIGTPAFDPRELRREIGIRAIVLGQPYQALITRLESGGTTSSKLTSGPRV